MTDYLDELLEQQEEEEQGGLPEWRKVGAVAFGGAERKTADARQGDLRREPGVEETARNSEPGEGNAMRAEERRSAVAELTSRLQQLHRAVRQAQERGLRTVASPQTAARLGLDVGQQAVPVPMHRMADYAAAVDAAFRRDARRYDGPLGLL